MHNELRDLLQYMLSHHIIGARHAPEDRLITSRIKHLPRNVQKEFYEEYDALCRKGWCIRLKKRTGKGSDWHISINPEYTSEIMGYVGEDNEI